MNADRMQFSLSLALVSWRAQLWANHPRMGARVEPGRLHTLQQPNEHMSIWQRSGSGISAHDTEASVTPNQSLRELKGDQ
ncbi:MAG TPA: hypothetical protein VHV31_01740 [Nitrolancea sp.]|nr:hypothetical protein [Nitrolancea sp.]